MTAQTRHLLGDRTTGHYRRTMTEGIERVARTLTSVDQPLSGVSPAALDERIAGIDLDTPVTDSAAALDEIGRIYLQDAVYFHHPRYLGHLNCPVAIPALLGETILSAINSSLDTWDQSAGATLIERRLIDWTASRIGLGAAADGVFTSGGTQSNLQALLLARGDALRGRAKDDGQATHGSPLASRLRILTSDISHFSIAKSAALLGLDENAVVAVATGRDRRMHPAALAAALERCATDGLRPMAVVATAGTTDFGSIDPLPEIAAVCERARVWMHVDAAYGCGLLVSRRRHLLHGLGRADSVTVDYHKSFFQPVSSSAILVRDGATLTHVTHRADYLNPSRSADRLPNQVDKSLQTTRRFDALKLWLTLRIMGAQAIGELFDAVVDRAADAWSLLRKDPRFEVVMRPQLSTLVFRYVPPAPDCHSDRLCDEANRHARRALLRSGEAVVARTTIDGRYHLKFTLLNPQTTRQDIAEVLDLIAVHAEHFVGRQAA